MIGKFSQLQRTAKAEGPRAIDVLATIANGTRTCAECIVCRSRFLGRFVERRTNYSAQALRVRSRYQSRRLSHGHHGTAATRCADLHTGQRLGLERPLPGAATAWLLPRAVLLGCIDYPQVHVCAPVDASAVSCDPTGFWAASMRSRVPSRGQRAPRTIPKRWVRADEGD